jgi:hypothetical protein
MSQKDATRGNRERVQGIETLIANANDGKRKKKSQKKSKKVKKERPNAKSRKTPNITKDQKGTEQAQDHDTYSKTSKEARRKTKGNRKQETMPHSREFWHKPRKAHLTMDWTFPSMYTDIRLVDENAPDSMSRKNESDSIETDEKDPQ